MQLKTLISYIEAKNQSKTIALQIREKMLKF